MATLTFDKPAKKTWLATGTLKDDDGNVFRVYVSGSLKAEVDQFIRYQRIHQAEAGQSGIAAKRRALGKKSGDKSYDEAVEVEDADLRIGISRVDPQPGPYRIRYTVDPPLDADKSQDITFDNQPVADVRCNVTSGTIDLVIFEITDSESRHQRNVARTITAGNSDEVHIGQLHTGSWCVRITARGVPSQFWLDYDKFVP